MKIVYGTTNPAKLDHMRQMLEGLDIELIGLNDLDIKVKPINESGNHPLENARIKALAYYKAIKMPVFSCDSGLYIEGIEVEEQPGVHVRRVNNKELNDEEMIKHYSNLADRLGGVAKAKYKNAICLILDDNLLFEHDGEELASSSFLLVSNPHPNRNLGFPLDSISVKLETGKYYMDLTEDEIDGENRDDGNNITEGYRKFFINALGRKVVSV